MPIVHCIHAGRLHCALLLPLLRRELSQSGACEDSVDGRQAVSGDVEKEEVLFAKAKESW
jgi:hypothetical protein